MTKKRKSRMLSKIIIMCTIVIFSFLMVACGITKQENSSRSVNAQNKVKVTQVRSTTIILEYGGKKFLIDPMLAEKGTMEPFGAYPTADKNPLEMKVIYF